MYHFKDHSEQDQYWRDIPLEVDTNSTARTVTDFLFKEHSYYFDKNLITSIQVEKLIQKIIENNGSIKEKMSKGLFDDKQGGSKDKPKSHNKLFQDIDKARNMNDKNESDFPNVSGKGKKLEPLGQKPGKLDPIGSKAKNEPSKKSDDFDLLGFNEPASVQATSANAPKNSGKSEDDFDFDFEDINPDEGSKVPPDGNKVASSASDLDDLFGNTSNPTNHVKKTSDKTDKTKEENNAGSSKEEGDDYIVIDGKRFREIQIEGEEDEFLMDDDGNIYDKEGVYIGTAKDGAEEEEEEAEK